MIVSTDVGGTFIDFVVIENGKLLAYKKLRGKEIKRDIEEELGPVKEFHHGTTVGINALLERKGEKVTLVTTKGFGTLYRIGRQRRLNLYSLTPRREKLPVEQVLEIEERTLHTGEILKPLDEERLRDVMEQINGKSVCVVLLNSYANPANEIRAKEILKERFQNVFISSEVRREIREYERLSTTVVEAYINPVVKDYLLSLSHLGNNFYVMQSNGGKNTIERIKGIATLMSGPAGGLAAAEYFSHLLSIPNIITYDMGGTSADVGGIVKGHPLYTSQIEVDGMPIRVTSMDIISIGAGGGSIAWLDDGLRLHVGPKSAGAVPGPACYARGGKNFTVTDANLLLGILGRGISGVLLKKDFAISAGKKIAQEINLDVEELAEGVRRIVNTNMSAAIKKISIGKGYDPRNFVLVAYGGAGPMHATSLAKEVGIRKVLVSPMPGAFSSLGVLLSPIRYDYTKTFYMKYEDAMPLIEKELRKFEMQVKSMMKNYEIRVNLQMRYRGQGHEIEVPLREDSKTLFEKLHRELYNFTMDDEVYVINAIFVATMHRNIPIPRVKIKENCVKEWRTYKFENKIPVYDTSHFRECTGPCIIEEKTSTVLVEEGWKARMGKFGEILMEWSG